MRTKKLATGKATSMNNGILLSFFILANMTKFVTFLYNYFANSKIFPIISSVTLSKTSLSLLPLYSLKSSGFP